MSNPNKRKGSSLETAIVKKAQQQDLYARKQPGSGVYKDFPNDVVLENLLVEAKSGYTRLNSDGSKKFSVDVGWLLRVAENAEKGNFEAGIVVIKPDGVRTPYAIVSLDYLLRVLTALKNCPQNP